MTWFFSTVVVPVIIIGALIIVHELGHFLLAKMCGVGVVRFSIGFGPAIVRWKRGETQYQIGCIPLGGYVRMVGDIPDFILPGSDKGGEEKEAPSEEAEEVPAEMLADRSRWFIEKGLFAKSAIVAAGPIFNLIFAVAVVFGAIAVFGEEVIEDDARIGGVMAGSPAEVGGVRPGDLVLNMNGEAIGNWEDLALRIHRSTGEKLALTVRRDANEIPLVVMPQQKEIPSVTGGKKKVYLIGIEPSTFRRRSGLWSSFVLANEWTWTQTIRTYVGLWGMIAGKISPKELAGPLFIFDAASKHAEKGLENVLFFMALLSVSLAVLNLLPIPVLDGGHLLFFLIEAVVGPISMNKKEVAQQVGLVFLLLLMGFAITNDIQRDRNAMNGTINWDSPPEPAK